jgi:RNA polymerase sigma-70 factor (ECF subfamily)
VQDNDALLVRQARQGDREAFSKLVTRHQRYVFNLAYRLLWDYEEARDLTQEAFLRAWCCLPAFRGEAKFTTWLYRIVTNLCLNRLSELRRNLLELNHECLSAPVEFDPSSLCEEKERREFIHRQIEDLPVKYRLVITLRYLHGFSYREIAEILGIPISTVKTHLFRAKEILRGKLKGLQDAL